VQRFNVVRLGTVGVVLVVTLVLLGAFGGAMARSVPSPTGHPSVRGPATHGDALGSSVPALVPARTYQTTVVMTSLTNLGGTTAVPQAISIDVNVTWGSIDNTNTKAWVLVYDFNTGLALKYFSLNGTINAANVVKFDNNGVLYEDYTWNFSLNKTTLGCTKVSCADFIPVTNDYVFIDVFLTENGASLGGGPASDSVYISTIYYGLTQLVSTFVNVGWISPGPTTYLDAVPFVLEFYTNTSWGWTTNATTDVWVTIYDSFTGAPDYNFSFNGSVNAMNAAGFVSQTGFNGTVAGVQYSNATWTLTLNKTTLACADTSCNSTPRFENPYGGTQGWPTYIYVWSNESGALAGGLAAPTGPVYSSNYDYAQIGSTLINGGSFSSVAPLPYQALPFTQTGWVNVSWVNPAASAGNATITGYLQVYDTTTAARIATISLNNSVNTVTAAGVSLSYVMNGNGTTPLGIPFVNYTWSITFSATGASLGTTVPYHPLRVVMNVNATGQGHGGMKQTTGPFDLFSLHPTFAEFPTTVTVSISPLLPAYVPSPYTQNFSIAVANAPINSDTTALTVDIVDLTVNAAGLDVVSSTDVPVVANQTAYSFSINPMTLTCSDPSCVAYSAMGSAPSPTDLYGVLVSAVVDGIGLPTNGTFASGSASASFYVIEEPLSAHLAAPVPGVVVTPGNVTVSVVYSGSFVSSVSLNIFSPTGALVFSQTFPVSGGNGTWVVTAPGVYTASVVVSTAYTPNTHYFNATLTVSKVPTNHVNTTAYSNATLIPGLSAAAAGALLLAIGLIVGMVAAFFVGRAVGGRAAPAAPQPWEGKPGEGAAPAANTCSVCGKSFANPDELQAHSKSEHGM
jgi:hypothetical protein